MTDKRTNAFRWLVRRLQTDPVLRREVQNWYVWDDTNRSNVDLPAMADSFSVRITPTLEAPAMLASDSRGGIVGDYPVLVRIETRTFGQSVDDSIDFWAAVGTALDRTTWAADMRNNDVSYWEWAQMGVVAGDNTESSGTIRLHVTLTT